MRYRLRTLLIVLALGPPVLAALWFACQLQTTPPARIRWITPEGAIKSVPNPDYPPKNR